MAFPVYLFKVPINPQFFLLKSFYNHGQNGTTIFALGQMWNVLRIIFKVCFFSAHDQVKGRLELVT